MSLPNSITPSVASSGDCATPGEFERFRPQLILSARLQLGRRLRAKVDPDDIVQETFLAAVAAAGDFRGQSDAQLLGWLRAILSSRILKLAERFHTAARDVRKERPGMLAAPSGSGSGWKPAADQSTPSQTAHRREQAARVADALGLLPADYREVLVLRNLEGLTFPEVAARMGRTVGAVTMLWARAVHQFRLAAPNQT